MTSVFSLYQLKGKFTIKNKREFGMVLKLRVDAIRSITNVKIKEHFRDKVIISNKPSETRLCKKKLET